MNWKKEITKDFTKKYESICQKAIFYHFLLENQSINQSQFAWLVKNRWLRFLKVPVHSWHWFWIKKYRFHSQMIEQWNFFIFFVCSNFGKNSHFGPYWYPSTYRPRLSNLEAVRLFWIAFLNENIKMKDFTQGRFKQICWPLYSPPYKGIVL